MTEIKQTKSLANDQAEDIDISFNCYKAVKDAKTYARENLQIVSSLSNSMNILCTNLDRLDNLMETLIFVKNKEKGNSK